MKRLFLSVSAPLPCRTAARELAHHTGARIVTEAPPSLLQEGDGVFAVGSEIERWTEAAEKVPTGVRAGEWELMSALGKGWIFAGSSPRNVCRVVLAWIAHPAREQNRLSRYPVRERFTMWDNSMNQMYRFARGLSDARTSARSRVLGSMASK